MKISLNDNTTIDLSTLIDTRLLVQANSGGGKSWLLRRILEQSHGKVQQIIIDLEGEFSTLREKYDYILAGKDGDIPVDIKSAKLLARKLLELNVSAIIDLYEFNHFERKQFVKLFLESLVDAPKKLWHPCIVVIDEAHFFCPEKGQSEASAAVIDLATRGRKRGYCAILATQRLSKLHKDAAAECNNKLIGRTGLDVDMKRAAEELGFNSKEQYLSLRSLDAGEFFAFGPAISNEVIKVTVGEVETTHPKAGSRIFAGTTTPPTEKIKKLLNQLQDIPQEVKREEEELDNLRNENRKLKGDLLRMRSGAIPVPQEAIQQAVNIVKREMEKDFDKERERLSEKIDRLRANFEQISDRIRIALQDNPQENIEEPTEQLLKDLKESEESGIAFSGTPKEALAYLHTDMQQDSKLGIGEQKILTAIGQNQNGVTRQHLTVLTGYKRSSRDTYLQRLRQRGYIDNDGYRFHLSKDGRQALGVDFQPLPTGEALREHLMNTLPEGEKRILKILIDQYPTAVPRDLLSETTGYQRSSRDTYLQRLNARDLIVISGPGVVSASQNLFI